MVNVNMAFQERVKGLLGECKNPALQKRWQEATSFGDADQADAFWIRHSEDLLNIVWLNRDGIRDITLLPDSGETMFNFLLLKNIMTFEVREREDLTKLLGLGVEGNLVVRVVIGSPIGQVHWVANTEKEANDLRAFLQIVMQRYLC